MNRDTFRAGTSRGVLISDDSVTADRDEHKPKARISVSAAHAVPVPVALCDAGLVVSAAIGQCKMLIRCFRLCDSLQLRGSTPGCAKMPALALSLLNTAMAISLHESGLITSTPWL